MIVNTIQAGQGNVNRAVQAVVATRRHFRPGMHGHGFFCRCNTPTGGLVIDAIGEAYRMWLHGNEPALPYPQFSAIGVAAMVGLA